MADQPNSIFEQTSSTQTQQTTPPAGTGGSANSNEQLVTLLSAIKNERGEQKYKTVEDALNALKHSQEYIPTLKQQQEDMQRKLQEAMEKANKVETLESTLQQLIQKSTESATSTTTPAGLTEEQIAKIVESQLSRAAQAEIAKKNTTEVATTIKAKFGEKAEEVFYSKAEELGFTKEEINILASRTPKAVLKLLGVESNVTINSITNTSSVNTAGFNLPQDSFIGKPKKSVLLGASTMEVMQEKENAKKMLDELAQNNMSIDDLTNPKNYKKFILSRN